MSKLLTATQMRALENAAIESGEVSGLELMERAGRGVVTAMFEEWPELAETSHRAVVLCGPGNNGGDGFVVARLLKEWGWDVEVFLYANPGKLPPDAKVNSERWRTHGQIAEWQSVQAAFDGSDVILDALFGTGLTRPLNGLDEVLHDLVQFTDGFELTGLGPRVVAVDIPSGLCADSGRELRGPDAYSNSAVEANLTVSFHAAKQGHHLADGYAACRALRVVDIGLHGVGEVALVQAPGAGLRKHHLEHKFGHGSALILTGGAGHTGAARLAARGALRMGAGLVTLGVPGSAQMEVACQITALMLTRAGTAEELAATLEDKRINVLCLGPGLGLERARDLVPVALEEGGQTAHPTRAVVLDADALTAYADAPDALFGLLHERCVLTPHAGEFARLFPDIAVKLNAVPINGPAFSKVDACRAAARRAGCVVLFKGPDTVIAAPDGRCSINSAQYERAAPWLATAGSGDVLAGFITGLLARGVAPMQAAETAAWLHVECARSFGPGLITEDLPEELPKVFRDLGV